MPPRRGARRGDEPVAARSWRRGRRRSRAARAPRAGARAPRARRSRSRRRPLPLERLPQRRAVRGRTASGTPPRSFRDVRRSRRTVALRAAATRRPAAGRPAFVPGRCEAPSRPLRRTGPRTLPARPIERHDLHRPALEPPRLVREPALRDRVEPREKGRRSRPEPIGCGDCVREEGLGQVLRLLRARRAAADVAVDVPVVASNGALREVAHSRYLGHAA